MDLFKAVHQCFTGQEYNDNPQDVSANNEIVSSEKKVPIKPTEEEIAESILSALFTADKPGHDLDRTVQDIVHTYGWYEGLAQRILDGIVAALDAGKAMGGAMKEAFDKAYEVASKFVEEHPVLTAAIVTIIAIGVLVVLLPWVVEALGFGELGIVEGKQVFLLCISQHFINMGLETKLI
jgi:hypothetical protein